MSLLFSSARRIASLSVSGRLLPLSTPRRVSGGSGGTGRGVVSVNTGAACSKPVSVCGSDGVGDSMGVALVVGVSLGVGCCVAGGKLVPGGACGLGRSTLGGCVGFCEGRACCGTLGCCCCVPGGRVASCWAGFCGVGAGVWANVTAHKDNQMVAVCKCVRRRWLNIKTKTPLKQRRVLISAGAK